MSHEVVVSSSARKRKNKKTGYGEGSAWFNPLTVMPHTMLQQRVPAENQKRHIDAWLKLFGMGFDDMSTVVDVTVMKNKGGDVASYRSKIRITYGIIVDILLFLNIVRIFTMLFFSKRHTVRAYTGDLSFLWTDQSFFATIPIMYAHMIALMINMTFQFMQADDKNKKWLVPFAIFTAEITPSHAGIKSINHLKRLVKVTDMTFLVTNIVTHIWSAAAGMLYIGSAIAYSRMQTNSDPLLQTVTLTWSIIDTILSYYTIGILFWSLSYFVILCFHQACRFKRLNKICFSLQDKSSETIPVSKRFDFMAEVIKEHDLTAYETHYSNRFWRHVIALMFMLDIALGCWFLYAGSFMSCTWIFRTIFWCLAQVCIKGIILIEFLTSESNTTDVMRTQV
jgi:hypothetical protein